ncbi:MAG: glutamine synthetase [Chitinophagaceae bacterium]|nr:glutamine synthetase [Chitinophagaceae bacterium]
MRNQQSLSELLQELTEESATKVKLAITDIDGVLRGKLISLDKFRSVVEKGFGFCDVVFGWDAGDQAYDNAAYTGWHTGYPDALAMIDINTFRRVPWENDLPFFLAGFPNAPCPRGVLKRVIEQAGELGYRAYFSQEFEWFNFLGKGGMVAAEDYRGLSPMSQGMFGYSILRASQGSAYFQDLFDLLEKFDVPLEGLHTETGPGVYEAAILYADVLEAADRAVLFKSGVKEIGARHGVFPTFMAKFSAELPGCSGHVHQSLWSVEGDRNLFFDADSPSGVSSLMESYIAGQLYCLPYVLPMYAPTVNSYKRLVEGAWAPTTVTWGIDNRTTALRALPGSATSTRLETRVVGSDANPYLAMAACLASGLYGIRKGLKLETPPTKGSGYADKSLGVLPRNLWEATQAMKGAALAVELFGESFVDHFTRTREWEWRQFSREVTDWELKRYFEII